MGDSSDNIPGVPKIGPKTASELMKTYGSIDGIYEHLDEIKGNSVRESLREHRDLADLSLFLATIKIDAEKAQKWLSNGAQPTDTVAKIFKMAGVHKN
jgi:DNA polymerase-1